MNIAIQSVHFDATTQLKEFIEKKLSKLDKFSDQIVDAEVILKVVKPEVSNNKEASVKLNIKNGELFANKVADTFEEAVVQSIEALEKQVLKAKEKTQTK
ncbi:putative sigma-54 modulation protein [Dysgonomonas sp. PFB1-18]|uniref:ribosome hibernation-promoting factor, HPF/YfiA family n=1 Tax=unclassified Dysgonomonas TaxID=2630389 RepID=UPI00247332E0|nr:MULTISPECIES: ribosome-associated translation inhibitor RaiA [unclassified Dysgonomonas]MDH6307354.1 putative sigma-54 modulation protein [Dysgonomonas sp. PF1-14]MDH6337272.1 putative sigma-54 modulation protein [Dysgonomonas sp. PF1-16]MDH6379196.1 putative sigma-54 modulation protein [Dysgonomonas sp. PFB1-18]MDH6396166.1 putative sigma-54 modulation protein [Dysgonomonas sp. PF1-23]